ncbi:MAG: OmpA family protein [Desulfobulbaceae bacterium]|nr:OmpA family protein [Desulfobulbaceae bacterium]MCK5437514.1 OmpA family protein [Desulfobulbaceae bacterium]
MIAGKRYFLLLAACILWLSGCSSGKTILVLLPDSDGHVGEIQVSNEHGVSRVNQANYAVSVTSGKAPRPPVIMAEQEVSKIFTAALAAEPPPPATYILYFFWDSVKLTHDSRSSIQKILAKIQKRASTDISVNGHADRCGSKKFNIELSRKRADKVRTLLIAKGVPPSDINSTSHGEGNPLIKTADNVPEPRNRRVEVIVR